MLPPDPLLEVSAIILPVLRPALHSSNYGGEKEKDAFQLSNGKMKAAVAVNLQLTSSVMRSPHFPGTKIALL